MAEKCETGVGKGRTRICGKDAVVRVRGREGEGYLACAEHEEAAIAWRYQHVGTAMNVDRLK